MRGNMYIDLPWNYSRIWGYAQPKSYRNMLQFAPSWPLSKNRDRRSSSMPPIQEWKKEILKQSSDPRIARFAGVATLVLIFFATGTLTWSYLSDTKSQTAAAAETLPPAPP